MCHSMMNSSIIEPPQERSDEHNDFNNLIINYSHNFTENKNPRLRNNPLCDTIGKKKEENEIVYIY